MFLPILRVQFICRVCVISDEVVNLEFTPEIHFIGVSWALDNPSGDVNGYILTYATQNGNVADANCFSEGFVSESSDCSGGINLVPCTVYDITVQPVQSSHGDIGVPATETSHTLPGNSKSI